MLCYSAFLGKSPVYYDYLEDQGSIPGRVITKDSKNVLDTALVNT